jgi:hypothetical protein
MSIEPGIKIKGPDGQLYVTGQRGRIPSWVELNLKYRVLVAKSEHPGAKVLVNEDLDQIYVIGQRGRVPTWVLSHPDYVSATSEVDNTKAEEKPVKTPVVAETQEKDEPVKATPVVLSGPDGASYTIGQRGRVPAWVVDQPEYRKYKGLAPLPAAPAQPAAPADIPPPFESPAVETVTVREVIKQEGNTYTFADKQVPVPTVQTDAEGNVDLDANTLNMYADRVDTAITEFNKSARESMPDYFVKKELHAKSRTFLKLFANKILGLEDGKFDVSSNPAGDAVSGEIILHTDDLYVVISCGSHLPIMFRKCHGRTDCTGEANNWACSARKLLDIHRTGL